MKIPKGAWVGFIVAVFWIIGVVLSASHCKWNPVCTSGANGIVCTILAWIFYVPAVIGVTSVGYVLKMFGIPNLLVINLICAIIPTLLIGMFLGAVVDKMLSKLRSKMSLNPPPAG